LLTCPYNPYYNVICNLIENYTHTHTHTKKINAHAQIHTGKY